MSAEPTPLPTAATARAELRRRVRQYVRYTLLADLGKAKRLPLCLPLSTPATLTDADVYTAGPGSGDRANLSRRRDKAAASPLSYSDPTGTKAAGADGWRLRLATELPAQPAMLKIEHSTVLAIFDQLQPLPRQTLCDLRLTAEQVAEEQHYKVESVNKIRQRALDPFLEQLLSATGRRVA